jgi:hypothetical protein
MGKVCSTRDNKTYMLYTTLKSKNKKYTNYHNKLTYKEYYKHKSNNYEITNRSK